MATTGINRISKYKTVSVSPSYKSAIKRVFNSLFEWKNLPEELQSRHIEGFLFDTGQVAFYKVVDKYYVLPATLQEWDLYGDLVKSMVYSPFKGTEMNYNITSENSQGIVSLDGEPGTFIGEFIYNNIEKEGTLDRSDPYFESLDTVANSLRIDILNSRNLRVLYTQTNGKDTQLNNTMNNIYNTDKPFIIINEGHNSTVRGEKFESKSEAKDIIFSWNTYEEKLYKSLGLVFDTKSNKQERVITSEIETSNFEASHFLKSMLELRKKAVEKINNKFPNLNIEVELSSNAQEIVNTLQTIQNSKLGETNEKNI